ncbi:MAG: Phage shock protein (PspC) family protein, partial [Sediminibacterium sp.]|nr:Phage shock protein (PspC) family protein [Sediminibacterium sp.]
KRIVITRSVSRQLNNSFHFNTGRNDWDFDEDWNDKYENWSSDVEYVMTVDGLERVDKKDHVNEDENNASDENNAVEQFKKSKEELQKEADKKQKELDDLKKELNKPIDSTRYQYKKATTFVEAPAAPVLSEKESGAENMDLSEASSLIALMQIVS